MSQCLVNEVPSIELHEHSFFHHVLLHMLDGTDPGAVDASLEQQVHIHLTAEQIQI